MPALSHRNANAAPARSRRRPRIQRSRRDWIAGTLVELDPIRDTITVRVQRGGYPLPPRGSEAMVDVSSAHIRASDGDGDGRAGLTDLFPGDQLHVTLQPRGRRTLAASRVSQESTGAPRGGLRRVWQIGFNQRGAR
jgi:hypothetical protein